MKKLTMKLAAVAGAVAMMLPAMARADADHAQLDERLNNAQAILDEVMRTPDRAIPESITSGAVCVAVVPKFKKAAFIVGAQYGQGVATCRTGHGWSAPVFIQMTGGSFGWQIGGQSTEFVMVAMNIKGMQDMLRDKFKIGADAAASAGPVGRNAQAGTDWKLNAELLTWSRSKGLFAGIDLDGTVVNQNQDATRTFYGSDMSFESILHGNVAIPADAQPFINTISRYFRVSREAQQ